MQGREGHNTSSAVQGRAVQGRAVQRRAMEGTANMGKERNRIVKSGCCDFGVNGFARASKGRMKDLE
jgi:hypothetical protein